MFERYDDWARRAIFHARVLAGRTGHREITPEHLLLGVLEANAPIVRTLLPGSTASSVKKAVEDVMKAEGGSVSPSTDMPLSSSSKHVLGRAEAERARSGHAGLSSGHLLVAILIASGPAATTLALNSLHLDDVRGHLRSERGQSAGDNADDHR